MMYNEWYMESFSMCHFLKEDLEMIFAGICLITDNVSRLSDFYKKVLQATVEGDETHVTIHTNGAGISIFSKNGMEDMVAGSTKYTGNSSSVLMFEVKDVDAEYERLKTMNIEFIMLPTTYPWGSRALWFKDPDGNIVDFYSKVEG